MAPLGPFEPAPRLAVAASGGADSTALALLAFGWAADRGGSVLALVVDHGLRPESAAEAALTCGRLAQRGIPARRLTLHDVARGPGLAARARTARYAALERACAEAGIVHLLLAHHAADQAETVALRMLDHSGPAGLAGMAMLSESRHVRRLRPLLPVPPGRLRATLRAGAMEWVEDPSNQDPSAMRARLRALRADPAGTGAGTRSALVDSIARGEQRQACERADAAELAARVTVYPAGYAILTPGRIAPSAFSALLRMVAGRRYPPSLSQVEPLAAALRPATVGGVRIMRAPGRLAPGAWVLAREAAAMALPLPACPGAIWDGRFHLCGDVSLPDGATLGALGADAAGLRRRSPLPAAVLHTLPALRIDGNLFAVPHLGYAKNHSGRLPALVFDPPAPAAGAPFVPAPGQMLLNWPKDRAGNRG